MRKTFLLLALFPVILTSGEVYPDEGKGILARCVRDIKWVAASPFRLEKSDIIPVGIFCGCIGGIMTMDDDVRDFSLSPSHRSAAMDSVSSFARLFGEGYVTVPLCCLLYIAGKQEAGIEGLETLACVTVMASGIKVICGRARPYEGEGPYRFEPLAPGNGNWSFPSGHTITAFGLASVMAGHLDKVAGAALYSLAFLTGLSRIYDDKHWASDVFTGAVLGTLTGRAIIRLNKSEKENLNLVPYFSAENRGGGLKACFSF